MIEDDFYSTIKFKSGEEIFCKVAASEEGDRTMLIISNPIIVEELTSRGKVTGYKFEPWLKFTTDDMFVVDMDNVLTMSESTDIDIILFYQDFIRKMNKSNYSKLSKEMGYITSVDEAKVSLENIFNNS
tara:strand:+ start:4985 stop:5371 length:387 start_codon:yes stop_codon:yes gene_type:complete